jgi:hypothetical protein
MNVVIVLRATSRQLVRPPDDVGQARDAGRNLGGTQEAYSDCGICGSIDATLQPIYHGILAVCGFGSVPPFLAFEPSHSGTG